MIWGKTGRAAEIIMKPSKLTEDEFRLVQSHPALGRQILSALPYFADITAWAGQHHERLNGRGYRANSRKLILAWITHYGGG